MIDERRNQIKTCLQNEPPFCTAVCPFGLDVCGFMEKMQQGRYNAAFRAYSNAVGFPGIVAHLCDEPCKKVCIRGKKRGIKRGGFQKSRSETVAASEGMLFDGALSEDKFLQAQSVTDGPIAMRLLERAAMDYATRKNPNSYNMPQKKKRIAIIGAGISGLSCALRLCSKKYDVTLYEQSDRIGGHLWDVLPPKLFLNEIEHQFMHESYTLCLNRTISKFTERTETSEFQSAHKSNFAPLSGSTEPAEENQWCIEGLKSKFDAVYIATGKGGDDFGLERDEKGAFATTEPGIFMGGQVTGNHCSSCQAMADGLQAVHAIERYIKVGSMNAPYSSRGTRLRMDPDPIEVVFPVLPADGERYTKDEALQEAGRCLKCACDACMRHCDLMYHSKKFPRQIADDVEATIHPGTLAGDGTIATRFISTCTHCGLCETVCPQGIDMGEFLLQSHHIMAKKGAMPWAFHDFWLRDMAFSNGDEAKLILTPKEDKNGFINRLDTTKHEEKQRRRGDHHDLDLQPNPRYLFFPGCQLGATDPGYVTESYVYLLARYSDTALMLHCCGAPAEWAGEKSLHGEVIATIQDTWISLGKPTFIFACSTCKKMFKRYLPEVEGRFLYSLLLEWGVSINGNRNQNENDDEVENINGTMDHHDGESGQVVSVFDPCSSRNELELQHAVRQLTKQLGFILEPLPMEGALAQCCSFGGHIAVANPEFTHEVILSRIRQNDRPFVTYCINCRTVFASAGKPVFHILDLLFGIHDSDDVPRRVAGGCFQPQAP